MLTANFLSSLFGALLLILLGLLLKAFQLLFLLRPHLLGTLSISGRISWVTGLDLLKLPLRLLLDRFCFFLSVCSNIGLDLLLDGSLFFLHSSLAPTLEPLLSPIESCLQHAIQVLVLLLPLVVHYLVNILDALLVIRQQSLPFV